MSRRAIPICVIMIAETHRPTETMVEKGYAANDDGAGIAWRETEADGSKIVVWKKGLDLESVKELCEKAPLPYVVHFRIASIGGIRPSLTHPFPISKIAPLGLSGKTKGSVLFHNGHWKEWADSCRAAAIKSGVHIPVGKWSDSRGMAWLCSIYGEGFMEFLTEQKGVIFGPNGLEVFMGSNGWDEINNVWCSNNYFMSRGTGHHMSTGPGFGVGGRYCRNHSCSRQDINTVGFCPAHDPRKVAESYPAARMVETVPAESTGVARNVTPFPKLAPGEVITLEMAEKLHKQVDPHGNKYMSKGLLKKIRKHWGEIQGGGKKKEKAWAQLVKVSSEKKLLNGRVH